MSHSSCGEILTTFTTLAVQHFSSVSISISAQDDIIALGEAHMRSAPPLSSLPQGCPRNSANLCLVEHRSLPTSEGRMLTASFRNSSFLQAISAVMLWPVHKEVILVDTLGLFDTSFVPTSHTCGIG